MAKKVTPAGPAVVQPWSVSVAVADIPDEGLHRDIEAPAAARDGVAVLADVRAVPALSASLDLMRDGQSVHVTGRVRGRVAQECVVTLEPVETEIDEEIEVTFAPPPDEGSAHEPRRRNAAEEPPEPLTGGTIDLGAIATEFLLLGVDPYPRKPGVEFTAQAVENDGPHPFAALEALKSRPGGGKT